MRTLVVAGLALAVLALGACSSKTSPPAREATEPDTVHAATDAEPSAKADSPKDTPSEKLVDCTVEIAPGEDPTPHLTEGAVVCFKSGTHKVNLRVETSLQLRGEPGAILDGGGKGPVIHIAKDRITVGVHGLTLTDGYAELGSGLFVSGYARLTLKDLVFEGNRAGRGGGVGLGARVGELKLSDCTFKGDDDVIITNIAKATLKDTTVEGEVTVLDGAKVSWTGGSFGTLTIRGTTTRAPDVTLDGVDGTVANDTNLPGTLTRK